MDADPDPVTERAAHLLRRAAAHAAFARAARRLAETELAYGQALDDEGQEGDGETVTDDAIMLMEEADVYMAQALAEDKEVKHLLESRRNEVSQALMQMPDLSLLTLRDAVNSVRVYFENMSDAEVLVLSQATHQTESVVKHQRDVVVTTGQHIEITLISNQQVRRDPGGLAKQLMTFITIALGFANYLPKLLELMNDLGRLLRQFHP